MPKSTEMIIRESLKALLREKSLDEITVQLVCDETCISRQTFYNHFYCLIDAFEDFFSNGLFEEIEDSNTYQTWERGWELVLEYLHSHREMLLHIYNSSYRDELIGILDGIGRRLVKSGIEQCANDFGILIDERDRLFLLDFYMHIFIGFTQGYFKKGMKESPKYLSTRICLMLEQSIRNSLPKLKKLEDEEKQG